MRFLTLATLLLAAAGPAPALTCAGCYLGVYDDAAMTRTTGTASAFQVKSVYLGVHLGDEVQAIDALRFEATYPSGFTFVDATSYVAGAEFHRLGDDAVHIQWPRCVRGSQLLFRVRFLVTRSVANAVVQLRAAEAHACGAPSASSWGLPAGCYVLNPRGTRPACALPVAATPWSAVKGLFR